MAAVTTGNIAVNLQRLDTTSGIVQNNQIRVRVQRIPDNNGGAVQGPVTIHSGLNQQFTLRKVTYAGNDSHDYQLVARHSGKCVDVSTISTAPAPASTSGRATPPARAVR